MASFNYYLRDGKAKEDTAIYLLFDDGVNRAKFFVQQSIHPKHWNVKAREARKSLEGYADFNEKLSAIQGKCKALHLELTKKEGFTVDALRERFKAYIDKLNNREKGEDGNGIKNFDTLTAFAEDYIKGVSGVKKKNTILQNKQTLKLIKEFETTTRRKLTFERINLDFYNDFIDYLTKTKHLSPNTIGKHIRNVKLFLNEATERGLNTKFDYKSKRFKAPRETVETIYLTEEELTTVYEFDFSNHKKLEKVRDLFIIGCYTGLRFSDFSQLKPENIIGEEIRVRAQKTGEPVVIPLHHRVKAIIAKYNEIQQPLPKKMSNQKMNDYLKDMGEMVGINEPIMLTQTKGGLRKQTTRPKYKLISTHTARRSFATNLYLNGFPGISIMKITGHKTEKAFMSYIRVSNEENANLLRKHWNEQVKLKAV